ncbi:DUF433 domain-containing protein [Treponema sp.]
MIPDRIELNESVLCGKPIIKGTRISVEQVIDHLASGWSNGDIVENYQSLTYEDIFACLAYASALVHEERIFPLKVG